jgi:hypothetical protein
MNSRAKAAAYALGIFTNYGVAEIRIYLKKSRKTYKGLVR